MFTNSEKVLSSVESDSWLMETLTYALESVEAKMQKHIFLKSQVYF